MIVMDIVVFPSRFLSDTKLSIQKCLMSRAGKRNKHLLFQKVFGVLMSIHSYWKYI